MEAPDQNKIIGKEIAVSAACYAKLDDKKSGYAFKEALTIDPIFMDMNAVTIESLQDCVEQLEAMGTYDEVAKANGYHDEGYKAPGLVIMSKLDPRVAMSVEFGRRWNKDSDMQAEKTMDKDLTFKWFLNDEHKDQFGVKGVAAERAANPEELDILSKLREITKLPSKQESYQPVLSRIKRGYRTLDESVSWEETPQGLVIKADPSEIANESDLAEVLEKLIANSSLNWVSPEDVGALTDAPMIGDIDQDDNGEIKKIHSLYYFPDYMVKDPLQELKDKGQVTFVKAPTDEAKMQEHGETGDDETTQGSYEKHALEPMMKKLSAHPAKMIKKVELTDEFGEPNGEFVKVMQVTHPSHEEMIGIHLNDPDENDIENAIEHAAKDGFEYIWVHRSPQQNNACEAKLEPMPNVGDLRIKGDMIPFDQLSSKQKEQAKAMYPHQTPVSDIPGHNKSIGSEHYHYQVDRKGNVAGRRFLSKKGMHMGRVKNLKDMPKPELESVQSEGAKMEKKSVHEGIVFNDWDNVDFFGVPKLGEESSDYKPTYKEADSPYVADPSKKDKEVAGKAAKLKAPAGDGKEVVMQAGSALAKPESEVSTGVKSGQAPLADKELAVGAAKDGKGDVMQGKGNSDDQQKELPASEIKTGKAADGKGKVMGDSKEPVAGAKPISEARKAQISELMKKNMSGKMAEMRKKKMQEKMSKRYGK